MAYKFLDNLNGWDGEYITSDGIGFRKGDTLPSIRYHDIFYIYNTTRPNLNAGATFSFKYDGVAWWMYTDGDEYTNHNWGEWWNYPNTDNPILKLTSMNGKQIKGTYYSLGQSLFDISNKYAIPKIPAAWTRLDYMYSNCPDMKSALITIDGGSAGYAHMFGTQNNPIKVTGTSPNLQDIANTGSNVSIYIAPTVSLLTQRCNSNGELDDNGTYCLVTLTIQGDPVSTVYTANFDIAGITSTRTFTVSTTSEEQVAQFVTGGALDVDTTYSCGVTVTDSWGTSRIVSNNLTTGFFTIDIQDGGKEIAFGTSANDGDLPANGLFKCAMDIDLEPLKTLGFATGNLAKLINFLGGTYEIHKNGQDGYSTNEMILAGCVKVAWGYSEIKPSAANTSTYKDIQLGTTFQSPPYVLLSLAGAPQIATLNLSVNSTSVNSFNAHIYASNTTTRNFRWLAIGLAEDSETIKNLK